MFFAANPVFPEGLAYSVIGFFVGILSATFGVGGGFVFFPFLNLVVGLTETMAAATSIAAIPFNSISGVIGHFRKQNLNLKLSLILVLGAVPGTLLAAEILTGLKNNPFFQSALAIFYIVLISLLGLLTIYLTKRESELLQLNKIKEKDLSKNNYSIFVSIVYTCFVSFVATLLGIGGGVLLVPYLIFYLKIKPVKAIATALSVMLVFSTVTLLRYLSEPVNPANMQIVFFIVMGTVIGAQVGVRIATSLKSRKLKIYFGIFQILIVITYSILKFAV